MILISMGKAHACQNCEKKLTFDNLSVIIRLQIPKIAIIISPVCGMRMEHQPASVRS